MTLPEPSEDRPASRFVNIFPSRCELPKRLAGLAALILLTTLVFQPWLTPVTAQGPTPTPGAPTQVSTPPAPTPTATQASSAGKLTLVAPDITAFPVISAYLTARAPDGSFISMIQPGQVTVLEDGKSRPVDELTLIQPGVRVMVAFDAAAAMGVRNGQGQTRFDLVIKALETWANQPAASTNQDDFSLLINQGSPATALNNPADWVAALSGYQPDFRKVQPSLDSLSAAILLASDATPRVGMGRSILFITSLLDQTAAGTLPDLAERANQAGVPVNVWLVGGQSDFDADGAYALKKFALQTGGNYFTYSGKEDLPDLEKYLKPLRGIYSLRYTSTINNSGSHTLAVKVSGLASALSTPVQFFNLTITPPNPMFLSPPVKITRTPANSNLGSLAGLTPGTQTLQILIEFPDGHTRPLKFSRLYVDDKLVSQNDSPPFDHFTWDLSSYTTNGQHNLRVEVQDSLGLNRISIPTPVELEVSLPANTPQTLLSHLTPARIEIAAAALAVIGLIIVIPRAWRGRKKTAPGRPGARRKEPRTQPAPTRSESGRRVRASWSEHLAWPKRPPQNQISQAHLLRLGEDNQLLPAGPILITGHEMTIGNDPILSTLVLNSACVEALHARLKCSEDGAYYLYDQGSIAGTWVNYGQISSEGIRLEHDDLIHIGTIPFRFQTASSSHLHKLTVKTYNESQ